MMPTVFLMGNDISNLAEKIVWGGDYQQVARKLEIDIAASPTDPHITPIRAKMGNMVKLFDDDGSELFRGYVFSNDRAVSNNALTITAYDGLYYLTKSKGTYNFKNMTAEAVTRKLAADFGIPIGDIQQTGISLSFVADEKTIYDIIMQAYTAAGNQNGKKYMPEMSEGRLNIIQKGSLAADYLLSDDTNITDSDYTESIEDAIDRVRIYDDKYNQVGIVQDADAIKQYGILQDVYKKETGKNAAAEARRMLKGIERTAKVDALGNTDCITGRAAFIHEPFSGLTGMFYINTDEHTWENGQYTMELTLDMENVMDAKAMKQLIVKSKEIKKAKEAKKSKKTVKKVSKKRSESLLNILEEGGYRQ